jgi:hypothetical protein
MLIRILLVCFPSLRENQEMKKHFYLEFCQRNEIASHVLLFSAAHEECMTIIKKAMQSCLALSVIPRSLSHHLKYALMVWFAVTFENDQVVVGP